MDLKEIYALVDYLVDEKLNDSILPQGPKGLRGQRGFDGKDGQAGIDGNPFSWEENKEKILEKIQENKLKFSDLTDDELLSLRGPRGQRGKPGLSGDTGQDGIDGKSFSWEEHVDHVQKLIIENKNELTVKGETGEKGDQGLRGLRGATGKEGVIGKDGINGQDGSDGKDFKFDDFTATQIESLTGERGPRGQRGKPGANGLTAYELWSKDNNGSELDFVSSLKGSNGKNGIHGLNGVKGDPGAKGNPGDDGKDAPFIIDIQLREYGKKFYFIFELSDGSYIETKGVDKPAVERIIEHTSYYSSSEGGGGASVLEVYKDSILVGLSESLNFEGDNIVVTYNSTTKQSTISVTEPVIPDPNCVGIFDEGTEITPCAQTIDFIGENVEVVGGTAMSDWALLSDVTTLAGYEVGDNSNVKVVISGQESVAKLGLTRIASEDIAIFELVRLISSTHVAKGSSDSEAESKISGMALNNASAGGNVTFVMFGVVEDASFTFPLLSKLFLQSDGTIGTTAPGVLGDFVVSSGESLGSGAIFVNIQEPEEIT